MPSVANGDRWLPSEDISPLFTVTMTDKWEKGVGVLSMPAVARRGSGTIQYISHFTDFQGFCPRDSGCFSVPGGKAPKPSNQVIPQAAAVW
jgi:hypothetical protein